MIELLRTLGALTDPPDGGQGRLAALLELGALPEASEHADLFLFQLPPFASIYLGPEGKLGGDARDRVAGFWRAVGQTPPAEPDHLGALLGLYAGLCEAGSAEADPAHRALLDQSATALLHEHMLPWLGPYLSHVGNMASPFYQRWAELLSASLEAERRRRGEWPDLSAHLRAAPALPDPRADGGSAFLDGLLAPVSSGMILTRTDLARGAARCGVGIRAGERRYALEAMLSQDAAAVLPWLATEARVWSDRHTGLASTVGEPTARHWALRARATAELLDAIAPSAWEATPCPT